VVPDFARAARRALPALLVSAQTFEAQLRYARRHMDVVDLATALALLSGPRPLARDACVITIDDGYLDAHRRALPILARLRVPATVFVPTDYIGTDTRLPHDRLFAALCTAVRRLRAPAAPLAERWAAFARHRGAAQAVELAARTLPSRVLVALSEALTAAYGPGEPPDDESAPMTWDMCRDLVARGIEVGSHSASHTALGREPHASAHGELARSKTVLEAELGRPARYVAFPNGVYSADVLRSCEALGYQAALTTEDRPNRPGASPFLLGRKLLWEAHGGGFGAAPSRAEIAFHVENVAALWARPKAGCVPARSAAARRGAA
jgi:peptidoglycan/xylan/chitin deacetylase (PgdA/CDA1 family)